MLENPEQRDTANIIWIPWHFSILITSSFWNIDPRLVLSLSSTISYLDSSPFLSSIIMFLKSSQQLTVEIGRSTSGILPTTRSLDWIGLVFTSIIFSNVYNPWWTTSLNCSENQRKEDHWTILSNFLGSKVVVQPTWRRLLIHMLRVNGAL